MSVVLRCGACAWLVLLGLWAGGCGDDSGGSDGSESGGQQPIGSPDMTQQPPPCQVGQTFTCMCSVTEMGTQLCQADGLSQCMCGLLDPMHQRFGCDPSMPLRMPCMCEDGRNGVKRCGSDGVVTDCDCDNPGAAGSVADPDADAG